MDSTITVRLPKKLRAELTAISKEENVPISNLVRESLQKYLITRRFQRLRDRVLPFAEAQGMLTDEDIFRQIS